MYSDDKACTFVGTAAYVPPEVLNSSPATFGYEVVLFIEFFFSFLVVFELVLFFSSVMTRCSFEMRTTRNDLWALGCTLYQMLSGTSPFKDASEWLIFQRIVARDIRFPNYFSEAAQDLIDKLLARNTKPHCYLFPLCFIPTFQLFFCKFASESFIFA